MAKDTNKLTFNWRPLVDIVALIIVTMVLIFGAEQIPFLQNMGFYGTWFLPLTATLATWLILRFRGITFRELGVRMPDNLPKAIGFGLLIALGLFILSYATEAMGMTRDLSRFDALKGNLPLMFYGLLFGFFGAGFYEEVVFRGFLTHRAAHMLGAGKYAWVFGILVSAAIFGYAHAYQGVYAIFYTGILGGVMAAIYVYGGRNLWPIIIGHGVYDSVRFAYFWYILSYGGVETLAG